VPALPERAPTGRCPYNSSISGGSPGLQEKDRENLPLFYRNLNDYSLYKRVNERLLKAF